MKIGIFVFDDTQWNVRFVELANPTGSNNEHGCDMCAGRNIQGGKRRTYRGIFFFSFATFSTNIVIPFWN